jgi:hypothetical protein
MNYVGIDIHKHYSVLCAQDEAGQKLREARIAVGTSVFPGFLIYNLLRRREPRGQALELRRAAEVA